MAARAGVLALLLIAGAFKSAEAQQWTFYDAFYYGCGQWSCVSTHYHGVVDPEAEWPTHFIDAELWDFATPEGIGGTLPSFNNRIIPIYGYSSFSDYGLDSSSEPPTFGDVDFMTVAYGPYDLEWPEGEIWTETISLFRVTATPEPASLLLVLSGVAGVGGIARRKRRSRESDERA